MKVPSWLQLNLGRRFIVGVPYVWLIVFFLLPFLILLRISVTDMGNGVDPFAPLVETVEGSWHFLLRYNNYASIFVDSADTVGQWGNTIYTEAYKTSLKYAVLTTLFCLLIGYPFAYFLARAKPALRPALLMLV